MVAGLPSQGEHLRPACLAPISSWCFHVAGPAWQRLSLRWSLFQAIPGVCTQTDASPARSAFEQELSGYFACLKLPGGHGKHAAHLCRVHDFSAARAHLIVSRPGRWSGARSSHACTRDIATIAAMICARAVI